MAAAGDPWAILRVLSGAAVTSHRREGNNRCTLSRRPLELKMASGTMCDSLHPQ